jgi:small subunit ribosomal protein S6
MGANRQYELAYLLPAESSEQDVADLQSQVEAITRRFSGTIDRTENWGRRKLAYEIGPHKEAVYVLHVLTGPRDLVKELDRRLKVIDKVVRHLVVRVDEELAVADRRRATRQAETAKRRERRGLAPDDPAPVSPMDQAGDQPQRAEV